MLKWLSFFILIFLHVTYGFSQSYGLTFEQVENLQKKDPRATVVFIHAAWCKYCDKMKNTTFQDSEVKKLLENDFYFISFDGEQKTGVSFLGQTFRFKPSGNGTGIHELAERLAQKNGKVSYPSLVFLNEKYEILYVHNEFASGKQVRNLLANWVGQK